MLHLVVGTSPAAWISAKMRGSSQSPRCSTASQCAGRTRARLSGRPPPVTCGERVHVDPLAQLPHRGRVDHARADQLVGERVVRARPRGVVEPAAGAVEQRPAGERVAVAAQPGAGEARRSTSPGFTPLGSTRSRSTTPTAKPTRSNSPGSMRSGCSDISPPSSAHPACDTPVRDAGDDVVDDLGHELADRDVVEEEERLGALHRDVVDRHRDEVDADGVVATGEAGDHRLRADAVGRRHEQRVVEALGLEREQAAEPADVADHLGAERGAHVRLDQLDRLLAGGDVDAGARVRRAVRSGSRRRPRSGVIELQGRDVVGARCRPRARASSR